MKTLLISSFIIFILTSAQTPQADLVNITSLPGLSAYTNYTSSVYSGYLYVSSNVSLHYMFFESQNNPESDPVVLWLNGGPGCSSMLGFLYEHGPFVFPDGSTNFEWNDYSWNTFANMIYLESPACVGYSYCADPYVTFYDNQTAQNNLEAVLSFFNKFPGFKKNNFYVSGESYGGVYVPYLVYFIDQYNLHANATSKINLKGFMVGNGLTDYKYDLLPAQIDSFYYHSLYSPQIRKIIETACGNNFETPQCEAAANLTINVLLANLNIYDIYRFCWNTTKPSQVCSNITSNYFDLWRPQNASIQGCTPPCVDSSGADQWLNNPQVRAGLNIWENVTQNWYMCANINYQPNSTASYWIYEFLITQRNYEILVYSGDTDGAVPTLGTIRWINSLVNQFSLVTQVPQSQWTLPQPEYNQTQLAGYYTVYNGLTFVQVKGVGHMVPEWQRPGAWKMISYFLNGEMMD